MRRELKAILQPQVLLAMATTVLGAGAMFTLYTYVAPVLTELTGASNAFIAMSLALIGIGFTLGNGIGGRMADWSLDGATRILLAVLAVLSAFSAGPSRAANWDVSAGGSIQAAIDSADPEHREVPRRALEQFVADHLAPWLMTFASRLGEVSTVPLYRGVALLIGVSWGVIAQAHGLDSATATLPTVQQTGTPYECGMCDGQ